MICLTIPKPVPNNIAKMEMRTNDVRRTFASGVVPVPFEQLLAIMDILDSMIAKIRKMQSKTNTTYHSDRDDSSRDKSTDRLTHVDERLLELEMIIKRYKLNN